MGLKSQHPDCNNGGFKYQEREKLRSACSASESLGVREEIITRVRETERQNVQRAESRGHAGVTVRDIRRATASEMGVGGLQKTKLRQQEKETSQAQETEKKRTRGSLVKLEVERHSRKQKDKGKVLRRNRERPTNKWTQEKS